MFERVKVIGIIFLCLALSLDAKPRLLNEKSGRKFHFTNIGDILSKDIVQLAESTSPNSDTFNEEQTDDPYDNNIEAETTAYSKTVPVGDSPDLASPRDQEEKFVNVLQKHYKGTFPEYGKETKADFSKNKELEDNLSAQPETVYFGHSDKYQGKNDNDNVNDYPIMDETAGGLDNLAAFDADASVLNSLKLSSTTITPNAHRKQHKTQSIEDILSEYGENMDNIADDGQTGIGTAMTTEDYEGHKSVSENDDGNMGVNEKPGNENEHPAHHVTDHVTESMDDKMTDSTNEHVTDNETGEMEDKVAEHEASHMTDDMDDHVTDHKSDNMDDDSSEELKKLKEKTEEEALWDSEEKLRQKLARKKKQKSLAKEKHPTKKKEKLKDLSEEILKDFDELKKHNTKTSEKPNHKIQDSKTHKAAKHIKYVHADESQVTGDAILDFLDKLLEKDPKELRHDVLAMTKEMQKEGKSKSDSSEKSKTAEKAVSSSDSSNTVEDKPQVARESTKPSEKPDEVDDWISQLENDIDVENQDKGKQKDTGEENKETTEDYYDEEYDQFHDGRESIEPDGGQSVEHEKNGQKDKEVKNKKEIKKKQDDHFDYEEFKEEALKMHNEYRRRHNAVALTWSESLAKKAHYLASKLLDATRTNFKRELEKQGENIAILPYSTKDIAKQAVEKWYAEITKFSFTSPSIKPETRDFTQIIWKNSKEVGMGFVHTPDKKKTLVIALYSPTGNDENKLRENLNTVHDDPYADIKRYFLSRP